jgi:hypothetical protein
MDPRLHARMGSAASCADGIRGFMRGWDPRLHARMGSAASYAGKTRGFFWICGLTCAEPFQGCGLAALYSDQRRPEAPPPVGAVSDQRRPKAPPPVCQQRDPEPCMFMHGPATAPSQRPRGGALVVKALLRAGERPPWGAQRSGRPGPLVGWPRLIPRTGIPGRVPRSTSLAGGLGFRRGQSLAPGGRTPALGGPTQRPSRLAGGLVPSHSAHRYSRAGSSQHLPCWVGWGSGGGPLRPQPQRRLPLRARMAEGAHGAPVPSPCVCAPSGAP